VPCLAIPFEWASSVPVATRSSCTSRRLQAIEGVEIVSVCNRSRESSERVAREFGIPRVYERWRELVQAADSDAIVIGTWPYMHAPITLAALNAEKHVMCEARMALDASEAHAMLEAARAKPHLVAQIVPSPFTLRVDQTVQRLIAEGYLGDILAIEVRERRGFLDLSAPLHWRQDFDLSGFNVMGLGIWYEAIMRWVGEATRVMAMGKTFIKLRHDLREGAMRPVRIPEHLDVIADMACGAQAHFGLSNVSGFCLRLSWFCSAARARCALAKTGCSVDAAVTQCCPRSLSRPTKSVAGVSRRSS